MDNELLKVLFSMENRITQLEKSESNLADIVITLQKLIEKLIERMDGQERKNIISYDKNFGDEKICACGHEYYRHFDTYDNMLAVGCKYCPCGTFEEKIND